MKDLIQRQIKGADRSDLEAFYEQVKSGELLDFIRGEIVFRTDVSLKEQPINIGDCFIRKHSENDYTIIRVEMIKENNFNYIDCTRITIDNETLEIWDNELSKFDLKYWKPFSKEITSQLIMLYEETNKNVNELYNDSYKTALNLVKDESN